MTTVANPILPGSHPDPDLIKVGDDFYLATTTFEWLPGVRIHHSRDLVNWKLVAAPLDGARVGNMRAVPDSGGNYIPSLSWHDGTYYLSTAIWGTWREHATMVARAKNLTDAFEIDPENPMLTSFSDEAHPLQKAGQGYFLDVGGDNWVLAHHVGRFWPGVDRCPLGRETCLQNIEWSADGWPRIAGGGKLPTLTFESPFEVEVEVDDGSRNETTLAGLILYYDTVDFVWAAVSRDEKEGRILSLIERRPDQDFYQQLVARESIPDKGAIDLKVAVAPEGLQFHWRGEGTDWTPMGGLLEVGHLSDEGHDGTKKGFTGSFVGLAAHDMQLEEAWAEFECFRIELPEDGVSSR